MSEAPNWSQSSTGTPPWGTGTPPWGSGPPPWLPSATWTSSGSAETSASSTSGSSPHAHLGAIIGSSVGGGLALTLLGALVYVSCRRRRLRETQAQDASGMSPAPFTVPPPPSRAEKSRRDPDVERQASGSCTPGNISIPPSSQDQELRNVLAHMTARVQMLEEERLGGLQVTNEDPPEYTPPPGTQASARNAPEKGDPHSGRSR
ncbi:hypothetical protein K525DRAFT_209602 [Schizophyllum commune Loenen D]|nr:hypothetical protein K525DRAFT_209602 [Schizophyllum commune Loenen D]